MACLDTILSLLLDAEGNQVRFVQLQGVEKVRLHAAAAMRTMQWACDAVSATHQPQEPRTSLHMSELKLSEDKAACAAALVDMLRCP